MGIDAPQPAGLRRQAALRAPRRCPISRCTRRACSSPSGSGAPSRGASCERSAEMAHEVGAEVVVVHPPFRWQKEYAAGFVEGIAALEVSTGIRFAVENMYPWRASQKRGVEMYLPHWDPSTEPYANTTIDLSHAAIARSDVVEMAERLGPRLRHIHLTDGSGSPKDEHLVPGRGATGAAALPAPPAPARGLRRRDRGRDQHPQVRQPRGPRGRPAGLARLRPRALRRARRRPRPRRRGLSRRRPRVRRESPARRNVGGMSLLRQPLLLLARSARVKQLVSTMPVSAGIVARLRAGRAAPPTPSRRPPRLVDDGLRGHPRPPRRGHPRRRAGRGHHPGLPRPAGRALARRADPRAPRSRSSSPPSARRCPSTAEKVALENARTICRAARNAGTTVTLDMEDHTTTDTTLGDPARAAQGLPRDRRGAAGLPAPHRGRLPPAVLRGLAGAAVQGRLRRARGRRLHRPRTRSTAPTCGASRCCSAARATR